MKKPARKKSARQIRIDRIRRLHGKYRELPLLETRAELKREEKGR